MLLPILFVMACTASEPSPVAITTNPTNDKWVIQEEGKTIETRFPTPKGYERLASSYATFLRRIPLKASGTLVHLYDGQLKSNQHAHAAILDYDTGNKDLQQCADAVMRIRAEYLFAEKKFDQIHFNFTNGFVAKYIYWMQGKRLQYRNGSFHWIASNNVDSSHDNLRSYLDYVYNFAGSLSLSKELEAVSSLQDIQPGDVWILGGSPGHAVTVMDVAINSKGEKIYMLSQGYMPAQDIHILKNETNPQLSPWYAVKEIETYLLTPEYTFPRNSLKRFKSE